MHVFLRSLQRRTFQVVALAAAFAALYGELRLAAADYLFHEDTLTSVQSAVALDSGNVDYLERLGELNSLSSATIREEELRLQPRFAPAWIDLAIRAEFEGDVKRAELLLQRAAEGDRTWLPRWVLINFYFRHDDRQKFWDAVRASLPFAHGDLAPLFDLCTRMSPDPFLVLKELAIETPADTRAYVNFLRQRGNVRDAASVARRLLETGSPQEDRPLVLSLVDQLIDTRNAESATSLWNDLAAKHWTPGAPIQPAQPVSNPEMQWPLAGRAFDWRAPQTDGVTVLRGQNGRGLTLDFSGFEPNQCVALEQIVPVQPDTVYRLRYRSSNESTAQPAGLSWGVTSLEARQAPVELDIPLIAGTSDAFHEVPVKIAAGVSLIRLQLRYARPAGVRRYTGGVRLEYVALDREPGSHLAAKAPVLSAARKN